ncbi:unnamed protein product [Linum tenue]|uniref:Uncharacterized protein n=1 Tax=Linum tenue TaxID=586396 RepID=A0AAV0QCL3_9ROSI|nr:unnamed protein product [Linum tenue]
MFQALEREWRLRSKFGDNWAMFKTLEGEELSSTVWASCSMRGRPNEPMD